MKRKTVMWVALFGLIAAACAGFYAFRGIPRGTLADIYVDGALYKTVELSGMSTFTVETEYGYNIIEVGNGTIRVLEADCDEQLCVHQGAIEDSLVPIVCLPHRLVIEIRESAP